MVTATMEEAEREAATLLANSWWFAGIPGQPVPVNPHDLATRLGIRVRTAHMDTDESGRIEIPARGTPTITLNRDDHPNRQRFTCAHELGHYIARQNDPESETRTFVDRRATLAGLGVSPDEIFANQFAAALLMPPGVIREWRNQGLNESTMAKNLGTSTQALNLRLRNLGLIQ